VSEREGYADLSLLRNGTKGNFLPCFETRGLMIEEWKERFAVGDRWRRMDGWGEKKGRKKGRKGGERVRRREWITILVICFG